MIDQKILALGHCTNCKKEINELRRTRHLKIAQIQDRFKKIDETNMHEDTVVFNDSDIHDPVSEFWTLHKKLLAKINEYNAYADVAGERKLLLAPTSFIF